MVATVMQQTACKTRGLQFKVMLQYDFDLNSSQCCIRTTASPGIRRVGKAFVCPVQVFVHTIKFFVCTIKFFVCAIKFFVCSIKFFCLHNQVFVCMIKFFVSTIKCFCLQDSHGEVFLRAVKLFSRQMVNFRRILVF